MNRYALHVHNIYSYTAYFLHLPTALPMHYYHLTGSCFHFCSFCIDTICFYSMASGSSKRLSFSPSGLTPESKSRKRNSGRQAQVIQTKLQVCFSLVAEVVGKFDLLRCCLFGNSTPSFEHDSFKLLSCLCFAKCYCFTSIALYLNSIAWLVLFVVTY